MSKKYSQEDIQKGFKNLAKLQMENQRLKFEVKSLKDKIANYEAKEVGAAMSTMGFNEKEAMKVITILKRALVTS